jgi:Tol biopolymer transport system component
MRRFVLLAVLAAAMAAAPSSQAVFPAENGLIVYQATVGDHVQLFTVRPDGSGVRQLTSFPDSDATGGSWSPDGSRIVFEHGLADSVQIEVMDADGTGVEVLTTGGLDFTPAFSPNGNEIAFERATLDGDGVWIMNAHGRGLRQVTNNPFPESGCGCDESPVFSPDGKRIAFVHVVDDENTAVFVVDRNGRHLRQLTPYTMGVSAKLDWSPAGTHVLVSSPQAERPGTASNLVAVDVETGAVTQLTHDTTPGVRNLADSYSPDGTKIVFARILPDGFQLFTMNADGSDIAQITHGIDAHWATWGPAPADRHAR